jgi:DNA-directed RNA polymerase specialized sigma24 family protein
MDKLPWGFTKEKTEEINALVNRYALDGVMGFSEMMEELAPFLKELHEHLYRRAELHFEGKPYLADELAGKIILDLYDEEGRIWSVTKKCEGKFWYAMSRKFKDYYYEMMRPISARHEEGELSYDELVCTGVERFETGGGKADPEEYAVMKEMTRQRIEGLRTALTPAELHVYLRVRVRRHEGYSTREIARDLNLAESTVTSWYSRINKRVSESLA